MDAQPTFNGTQPSAMSSSSSTQPSPTQPSPTGNVVPPAPRPIKAPSTEAFLKDFTLVAEAAKRAQMAVLMRDFESVGLN
ncbi:hypothetical protein MYCTH_2300272 [Thermothelomyces thermophilus ATCC 42464]|uniref:Uncharacterized protein n=1 Tax=Thermothelomyces thermophilus (strain ATCC 42464 / BCRC 31852 / DSM 1799) TaxID=573729 RepID=G2QAU1_THET4|nr:uncharacterized protein MYCTH_2300272 [Thermothelomyces thermophilus ATCC 42464]AEO55933.1 hypothetical protein MYCTH_2300272 [Thermothelomyces thermophilus ATCC 42464]